MRRGWCEIQVSRTYYIMFVRSTPHSVYLNLHTYPNLTLLKTFPAATYFLIVAYVYKTIKIQHILQIVHINIRTILKKCMDLAINLQYQTNFPMNIALNEKSSR